MPRACSLGAPWAFNEWPMMRGSANSFTAVAHPGASLLRVTAKSFWHVLAHHKSFIPLVSEVVSLVQIPPRERTPPQMMLLSDLIRRHRMFERMDPGKVDELVRYIQCVAYDDNELLFFEGQVQQELLLIMKGNVAVFSNHGVLAGRQLRERVVAAGEVKYEEIADANTAPVPKLDPGTMRSLGMSFSHGMSSSSQGGSLGAALESARAQIHRESSEGSRSVSASPEPARRLAQQPPARHSSRSLIGPRPSESPTLLQRRSIDGADGRRPLVHRVEVRRASESFTSPTSGAELGHPTVAEGRARPPDAPGPSAGVVPRGAEDGAATESARGGSEGEMEMEMGSPQAHARSPMPRGDADSPESAVSRGTTPVPTAVLADGEMLVLAKEDDTAEAHVELVPIAEGDEDADAARSGALEGGLSSVSGGLGSSFAAASPRSAIHRAGSGQGYVITLAAGRQQGVPRGGGFNTRPPGLARAGPGKASPETVARASEVPVGRSPRGGKARGTGLEALAQPRMPKARVTRRDVPKRIETGDRRGSPERGASAAESTASVAHDRAMPVDGAGRQQARRRSLQGYAHNVHGHHGRSRLGQGVRPALGGVAVEDRLDGPLAEVPEDEWEEVGPGRSKTMRERLFLGHDKWEECLGTPLDQAAAFDVLGQGGLLKAGEARSATAVAINKTLALVVRRRHFLPLFVRERHRMVHVADLLQLLEVPLAQRTAKTAKQISYILQSNGVLEQFDPRIRVDLCQSMRLVSRESGEHLYRQGDVADSFYVVLQGMVSVHVKPHTADYSEKYSSDIIGRFGPVTSIVTERGILGDVGASRGAVRHNTVVAHEPTKLAAVSMSSFKVLMQKVEAEERLSQAHYLRKIPGMQDWDPVRLSQVSEMFVLERYKRGQVVLQQGAPADAFTIIKRGQVQVRCRLLTTSRQQLQQRPQKAKDVPPHLK